MISEIDEFKGTWKALGTLAPERLLRLRRVATIESVGSSTRIEGSTLSNVEVERLLSNLQVNTFSTRDEQEVAGYAEVMETLSTSWQEISLTENHIKQLHRDLLKFSSKDEHHRGRYKKTDNRIAAFDGEGRQLGVVFDTASPFDTPRLMTELIDFVQQELESKSLHPLIVTAIFVVVFLEIHPFQDGNGRLSRILTTLLLLRAGYAYVPFSSLESLIEQDKENYYLALRQTQRTIRLKAPNWQPWVMFLLKSLLNQVKRLAVKIEREKMILSALPELSLFIVDQVRDHGRVTIGETVKLTGANRNTLKEHFRELVRLGHLRLNGRGRGVWYDRP